MFFSTLFVLCALFAHGYAQTQRIALSQNSFSLTSGMVAQVQFRLDAPIICTSLTTECAVTIRLTNMDTTSVALDTCLVKWRSTEWSAIRTVTITARNSFVDDAQKTITLIVGAANSSSVYYNGFRASNITLQTQSRRPSQCSATGDPHYTTFDGYYYHFYDPVQNVVYRSTALGRTFEVQARLWIPPYARHCALAGREENDMVIIDECSGTPRLTTRFSSPTGLTPRVVISGSTYEVYFRSGAYMRADAYGWGMNVYFTAPGQDYNRTVGMCGNNNGKSNDDARNYVNWHASDLFPEQRLGTRQDLWSWYPSSQTVTPTLPPYAQECATIDDPFVQPVLIPGNGIDVTELLMTATDAPLTLPPIIVTTTAPSAAPASTAAPLSNEVASNICRTAIVNSSLYRDCDPLFIRNNDTAWLERYVAGCAEDTSLLGVNPAWVAAAIQDIQNSCATLAALFQQQLMSSFCPTANSLVCSGRGSCVNNTCVCTGVYRGNDCTLDVSTPPEIVSLSQSACDIKGSRPCPQNSISVSGSNFINTGNVTCRFNNTLVSAMYMGNREVWCAFPMVTFSGAQINMMVSVSNDLRTWSNALPVTYYDSNCVLCDAADFCIPNPNSCTINGVCYSNGAVNFDNPCQICNRASNPFAWSYSYVHSICGPRFDFPMYSLKVVGVAPSGFGLKTLSASNPLVAADASNVLTYSINSTASSLPFRITNDQQNRLMAVISTSQIIDVAALDQARLPGTFSIYCTDSYGNVAMSSAIVSFVTQDTAPTFNATTYGGHLSENATIGSVLVTIVATPGVVNGVPLTGVISYDWVVADPHFDLNSSSGVITLVQPLDYALTPVYILQVRARDPSGQYTVVDVRVNVTYVPKPPTNVLLTTTVVNEKVPINTVVGVLSTVDPGSTNFTYTVSPPNLFHISNNLLLTSVVLDYETGPRSINAIITTTDETGFSFTKPFVVTVNNVIEPPSNVRVCPLTGCDGATVVALPDDIPTNQLFGVINYTNPDGVPVTCQVYPNATFGVVLQDGVYKVFLRQSIDYRIAASLYMFPVCTVIGNAGTTLTNADTQVVVNVINRPKAPSPANLTLTPLIAAGIPETTPVNVVIGTVSSVNNDATATNIIFSVPSDPTGATFQLSPPTCQNSSTGVSCSVQVTLITVPDVVFNADGTGFTTVTVRTTDSGSGKFLDTVISVPVQFVNSPPLAPTWVGGNTFVEGSPTGTVVGTLVTNDVHPNLLQDVEIIGSNDFEVVLVNSRRSVGGSRFNVVVRNSALSFRDNQAFSLSMNVTNFPPTGPSMSTVHSVSLSMMPRPWSTAIHVAAATFQSGSTINVNKKTATGTVLGSLGVDNFDRADELSLSYSLISSGSGYFTLSGNDIVRTSQFLLRSAAPTLTVMVNASFTRLSSAPRTLPFVAWTVSTFTLNVRTVTDPPQLLFSNGQSSVNASIVSGTLAHITALGRMRVTTVDNSLLTVSISNDPQGYFAVDRDASTDSFDVWIATSPTVEGPYGPVIFTVVVGTQTLTATMAVTVTPPLNLGGGNGVFQESSKGSLAATSIAGVVVAAVVGIALIALLVAVAVVRRRKERLQKVVANEPFYNTVGTTGVGSLDNPTYLGLEGSSTGDFDAGLQNPMYAWYRPDMNREETEEFLVDQVDGAFVIRDSTATPGWHMLAVKTHNAIVHEKIKMSVDGLYELLPSSTRQQPRFSGIPDLVEHYSRQQDGVRYSLALDNPLYDNSQMAHRKHGHAVAAAWSYHLDPSAPSVPLKEREKATVQQIVEATGDEIYTNAEQAKDVLA